MKVKCFTHTDLDGVVSNVLFCVYYNMLGYGHSTEMGQTGANVDGKIREYLNSREYDPTDTIIITDICPTYDMACILDNLPNPKILIDHHDTSREMLSRNKKTAIDFSWGYIAEGDSATMLCYRYIEKHLKANPAHSEWYSKVFLAYRPLVAITDLWDTKPRNSEGFVTHKNLIETILNLYGTLGFTGSKARFYTNPNIELTDVEQAKVDVVAKLKQDVLKFTNVFIVPTKYKDTNCVYGVSFSSLYRSELADYMFQTNSELIFAVIINMNTCKVSFRRSLHPLAQDLDLTRIAKHFDLTGGGHPFACGCGFSLENYKDVIDSLLSGTVPLE
jgi:oligoribonuclease NrnB/cAMP/cGMP phosphodiesterase (DHH superfamily)